MFHITQLLGIFHLQQIIYIYIYIFVEGDVQQNPIKSPKKGTFTKPCIWGAPSCMAFQVPPDRFPDAVHRAAAFDDLQRQLLAEVGVDSILRGSQQGKLRI